jgi:hypothetical protein
MHVQMLLQTALQMLLQTLLRMQALRCKLILGRRALGHVRTQLCADGGP